MRYWRIFITPVSMWFFSVERQMGLTLWPKKDSGRVEAMDYFTLWLWGHWYPKQRQ